MCNYCPGCAQKSGINRRFLANDCLRYRDRLIKPVLLKQVLSDKAGTEEVFETQSVNISGSGILVKLAESEECSLVRGEQVTAEFCVEFHEITREFRLVGNVVREFSKSEPEGDFRLVALSFNTPEFDKQDREDLIEFVLDLQIANYTQSRMGK